MAALTIDHRPILSGGHLKEPVQLRHTTCVDGLIFWRVAKSDQVVLRLLWGRPHQTQRPLSKTNIVEKLSDLRNECIKNLAKAEDDAVDDLGLDDDANSKSIKVDFNKLPSIIEIDAPTVGDAQGMRLKILPSKFHQPIWLELSIDVIEYLRKACWFQAEGDTISRNRPQHKATDDNIGVSWEERRQSFRARRVSGKCRYFSVKSYGDIESARLAASEWVDDDPDANCHMEPLPASSSELPCLQDEAPLQAEDNMPHGDE